MAPPAKGNEHDKLLVACGNLLFAMSEPLAKRGSCQLREEAIEEIRVLVSRQHVKNEGKVDAELDSFLHPKRIAQGEQRVKCTTCNKIIEPDDVVYCYDCYLDADEES